MNLFSHSAIKLSKNIWNSWIKERIFFPYFFNTKENQNYVGYMPDKKFYNPDDISSARKEEFLT